MKKILVCLLLFAAAITALGGIGFVEKAKGTTRLSNTAVQKIGVTHAGGNYCFGNRPYLQEGAEEIQRLGAKVIKLWLTDSYKSNYAYNTPWENHNVTNAVELLQTPYYKKVLAMDFTTYIFEFHEFDFSSAAVKVDYTNGLTSDEAKAVEDLAFNVAEYLAETYANSGKNFVLQNWEGDNMVVTNAMDKDNLSPSDIAKLDGFRDWVNARQRGIDRARAAARKGNAAVEHAMEVNFIPLKSGDVYIKKSWPLLIDYVLPFTDCDLYSYSCWSAKDFVNANSLEKRLKIYNEKIGETFIDAKSGSAKERRKVTGSRIMLGEFGAPENIASEDGSHVQEYSRESDKFMRINNQIQMEQALKMDVRYLLFWELYCNEGLINVDKRAGECITKNEDTTGFYLIKPNGTYSDLYYYIKGMLEPENELTVNDTEFSGNEKIYTFSTPVSQMEIGINVNSLATLSNSSRERFSNLIMLYAAGEDGVFERLDAECFLSRNEGFRYKINFINKHEIPLGIRKIKVKLNASADWEIDVESVKINKMHTDVKTRTDMPLLVFDDCKALEKEYIASISDNLVCSEIEYSFKRIDDKKAYIIYEAKDDISAFDIRIFYADSGFDGFDYAQKNDLGKISVLSASSLYGEYTPVEFTYSKINDDHTQKIVLKNKARIEENKRFLKVEIGRGGNAWNPMLDDVSLYGNFSEILSDTMTDFSKTVSTDKGAVIIKDMGFGRKPSDNSPACIVYGLSGEAGKIVVDINARDGMAGYSYRPRTHAVSVAVAKSLNDEFLELAKTVSDTGESFFKDGQNYGVLRFATTGVTEKGYKFLRITILSDIPNNYCTVKNVTALALPKVWEQSEPEPIPPEPDPEPIPPEPEKPEPIPPKGDEENDGKVICGTFMFKGIPPFIITAAVAAVIILRKKKFQGERI